MMASKPEQNDSYDQFGGRGGGGGGYGGGGGGTSNFNPSYGMSEPADDRIPCKFCGRKFNETAAERHIPVCEQKHKANLIKMGGKPGPPKRGGSVGLRGGRR